MLVNGKPLLIHAYDHAMLWGCDEVTIVASPGNVGHMCELFQNANDAHWVVQPRPKDIVDAILRGIRNIHTRRVLILCADNTFEFEGDRPDLSSYVENRENLSFFGARNLPPEDASRFTRYVRNRIDATTHNSKGREFIPGRGVKLIDARDTLGGRYDGCWIGPLLMLTSLVGRAACVANSITELILLSTDGGKDLMPIPMLCSDMGVPEELTR